MRRRWFGFDFSHWALASRILASPGLMSYLSKSKWMSFRSCTEVKVFTSGRVAGAVAAPDGALGCAVPPGCAVEGAGAAVVDSGAREAVVSVAPVGAGAAAGVIVAGRFAQPTMATPTTMSDTSIICARRDVAMPPPFSRLGGRPRLRGVIVSRQSWRPRRTCRFTTAARDRILLGAVGEHRVDLPSTAAIGLEGEVAAVGSPRRPLVVTGAGGQAPWIRPVGINGPQVVCALRGGVDDGIPI